MGRKQKRSGLYADCLKRVFDAAAASGALIVLSPVLGASALMVRIKLGSPVVFKQARAGRDEKIFYLYKFRSMTDAMDENGMLLPDSERLTKFGKFLRASSIDELPELINIIKGDMSIVGPRPLSIYYLPHYGAVSGRRHEVRPGLTGYAQVNGRNKLDWDERFEYDVEYVDKLSFSGDIKIILDTVKKVLKGSDVTVRGTTGIMDFGPYSILAREGKKTEKRDGMTYSEIGSYFWLDHEKSEEAGADADSAGPFEWLPCMGDSSFAISGRTALDLIVRDILSSHDVSEVHVPSYCGISMMQAFIDHGLKLRFYDIGFRNGKFRYEAGEDMKAGDVVLVMSYFGLDTEGAHEFISRLHDKGCIVIEDITHSLLRVDSCSPLSDYAAASLRKWFPLPSGGWMGKRTGTCSVKPGLDSSHTVVGKIQGMRDKYDYIRGAVEDKESFLTALSKFENDLIHVDRSLRMDDFSLSLLVETDVEEVIAARRRNAKILIEGIRAVKDSGIRLPAVDLEKDVPYYLPIFLRHNDRDALRSFLNERGIYCPVHYVETMGAPAGLRRYELSLVCDQRYGEGDMRAVVQAIREFCEG
ncbi:MAG: sugar transferase [Lachnospiraceae bacterium]|nr:sugar transferase [Lachnospiraceae bacterium]